MQKNSVLLSELLEDLVEVDSVCHVEISGLSTDSRQVKPGYLFIALKGLEHDGVDYIPQAVENGARVVIVDALVKIKWSYDNVQLIHLKQLNHHVAMIASRFYGDPSSPLTVVGVTGTNGKTSVTYYIAQLLNLLDKRSAVIGTIGNGEINALQPTTHTTPDAIALQKTLASFLDEEIRYVAMEVSSHALAQHRVDGVEFDIAVFTNFTQDHLDYHGTLKNYLDAKLRLFESFSLQHAVINLDDPVSEQVVEIQRPGVNIVTFGIDNRAALVNANHVKIDIEGISANLMTPWGDGKLQCQLLGRFNLSNVLAAIASVCLMGFDFSDVLAAAKKLEPVKGRMQIMTTAKSSHIIIDYAHTPDALEKALYTVKEFSRGRVITVFGCGGDRDKTKRPLMAKAAEFYSDLIILTDDNPRHESPIDIMNDIVSGLSDQARYRIIHDREHAIREAMHLAHAGDCILIAGKGHENYQIIKGERLSFDDAVVVRHYKDLA